MPLCIRERIDQLIGIVEALLGHIRGAAQCSKSRHGCIRDSRIIRKVPCGCPRYAGKVCMNILLHSGLAKALVIRTHFIQKIRLEYMRLRYHCKLDCKAVRATKARNVVVRIALIVCRNEGRVVEIVVIGEKRVFCGNYMIRPHGKLIQLLRSRLGEVVVVARGLSGGRREGRARVKAGQSDTQLTCRGA